MVSGLLMELEDHNCWTIAEAMGHRGPHRLQHLLSRAVWDEQQMLDIAAGWAAGHLDDRDGVLIVDETADEKSSTGAAGPGQYSGTVGGIALCQVAVTLTYATSRGHALIGRACTCSKPALGMRSTATWLPRRGAIRHQAPAGPRPAGPRLRAGDPRRLRDRRRSL
jgi:SRSO17 transposase